MAISRERFTEGSSGFIRGQITDQNGDPVDIDVLTAARLTLYDLDTFVAGSSPMDGIINGRQQQDILGVGSSPATLNDVTYETNGYFQWDLQPEDNVILTPRRQVERHRARFQFSWTGGSFNYEIEIEVVNLRTVS